MIENEGGSYDSSWESGYYELSPQQEKFGVIMCQELQATCEAGSGQNWDYHSRFLGTKEKGLMFHVCEVGL